ncbi:hypothetical protein [Streptomyces sp. NPDC001401]|uniref:hypothetical protein n=1 Tax=Streptomyces sp. NPDC001401 TaxID=3364570 RepID=UPI0036AECC3B
MTSTDTSPLVLHGRRRSVARLGSGELLLDTAAVRRRIPVTAIERVDVNGPKGRRLTIVLTSTGAPVTYTLLSHSAPAVREFAEAVRRALPVRDADESQADGVRLVSQEPLERPAPDNRRRARRTAGAVYILMPVALLATGAGPVPVILWMVSPGPIACGWLAAQGGWRALREGWALRTRGIVVEGRLKDSWVYDGTYGPVTQYVYEYVDTHGAPHEHTGSDGGGAERVEILYDSADPASSQVGRRTAGWLVFGTLLFLVLGVPMLLVGGVLAAVAVYTLLV